MKEYKIENLFNLGAEIRHYALIIGKGTTIASSPELKNTLQFNKVERSKVKIIHR